ncbi:hypothetical protein PAAG_07230 [Paracoccidioides lutzii Pb01]|uniref:Thioesterase family protein n=1 Tax=Paracoccidioides lutzii (strain ATCC MYA-826 / Pb01) TaxID=502779 RepID=C1H8Y9_PARBA|nr:hypothetical protein PAAG_07230 [Paracoccidioides lutzii Pb01]EEH36812.1 hypothetical protein PAAG_07230 [Paracoccidioides lutzii Pb01]
MNPPAHTQAFEDAIKITPVSSHTYSANLAREWAVGNAANGGYITAILYRLAITHFQNAHPTHHSSQPRPINMQLSFLRRSLVGPAFLTVRDVKLGARISTIQVTMSQADSSFPTGSRGRKIDKVTGFVTISDPVSEAGVSAPCSWTVYPPPPDSKAPQFSPGHNGQLVPGSPWKKTILCYPEFRRASSNSEFWEPVDPRLDERRAITDQWARLRPNGPKGGLGRWTGEALAYLVDIFPVALGNLEIMTAKEMGSEPPFWFPTIVLHIDFKKPLPKGGVEWLYSRITTKVVRNGRTDIEVVVMDEQGDVVALATQLGLVVGSNRNTGEKAGGSQSRTSNL